MCLLTDHDQGILKQACLVLNGRRRRHAAPVGHLLCSYERRSLLFLRLGWIYSSHGHSLDMLSDRRCTKARVVLPHRFGRSRNALICLTYLIFRH